MTKKKKIAAVVLAAGQGRRMGTRTAKQYLLLDGKPVLYYALKAFEESSVDEVVLVTGWDEIEYCRKEILEKYQLNKVAAIVAGGKERYHSVANGLAKLKSIEEQAIANSEKNMVAEYGTVLIHDGARPFVTPAVIEKLLQETVKYDACVIGTPVKDTVKIADKENFCAKTPPRKMVWSVQTPQSFTFSLISDAYEKLLREEEELLARGIQVTDDAMVVEYMTGKRVKLVEGDYTNIKLTTPEDMVIAEAFLKSENTL